MIPSRYESPIPPEAKAQVSSLARVACLPWMQDWPLEVADASRVREFADLYRSTPLGQDARRALMGLILCSLDECDLELDEIWSEVRDLLVVDSAACAGLIVYWSCLVEAEGGAWKFDESGESFSLTPRMRELLLDARDRIGFVEFVP